MGSESAWQRVLDEAAPGQHVAQLYTDIDFLARAVARFAATGLRNGEGVIAVATRQHWRAIRRRLEQDGFDLDTLQDREQLIVLDAADTLAGFMMDGMPDRTRFRTAIAHVIDRVWTAGFGKMRAFGEIVDLLRRTNVPATLALEELWNEVLIERGVALLCGYSLDPFDHRSHRGGLLQRVSGAHSDLILVDDYERLECAVVRAYAEVFAGGADASSLRRALLQYYPRPAAMPDAAASILAARELVPASADVLLASVRRHYMGSPRRAPQALQLRRSA